jgi:hypothetical protein
VTGRPADFDRLGDLLNDACGPLASGERAQTRAGGVEMPAGNEPGGKDGPGIARLLASTWTETMGEEVAANARPVQLRQGRLTVSASSSAWAQTLQLMAETIKDRLNDGMDAEVVSEVVFRHAGWEGSGRRSPVGAAEGGSGTRIACAASAPTPEEEAAIAGVKELGLDPDLEESILRAMRASFGRA